MRFYALMITTVIMHSLYNTISMNGLRSMEVNTVDVVNGFNKFHLIPTCTELGVQVLFKGS